MTDYELRKLNRTELLEILIDLTAENDALKAENERLKQKLSEKESAFIGCGPIDGATVQTCGVLSSVQEAVNSFIENVEQAKQAAKTIADAMIEEARLECERMKAETQKAIDSQWNTLRRSVDNYFLSRQKLNDQLEKLYQEYEINARKNAESQFPDSSAASL